jgi:hypothetical protein
MVTAFVETRDKDLCPPVATRLPELIANPPVKVLDPVSVSVPVPDFVTLPAPLITPE